MSKLVLTEKVRSSLKRPLGLLLAGEGPEVYRQFAEKIAHSGPPRVILVGDAVSRNATGNGVRHDVMIVDNRERRARAKPVPLYAKRTFLVQNEPGTISGEAWAALDEAVDQGAAVMIVDGEEDLLVLAAIAIAPSSSIVAYGQPDEGLVVVRVDRETKKRVGCLLQAMRKTD